jgi:hypothetical protein
MDQLFNTGNVFPQEMMNAALQQQMQYPQMQSSDIQQHFAQYAQQQQIYGNQNYGNQNYGMSQNIDPRMLQNMVANMPPTFNNQGFGF